MKGIELLETYPKVAKVIRDWFTKKMIESMENSNEVPEDFKNHMRERGAPDDLIINIINKNPSAMFEIFDSLHVYVGIAVDQLPETEQVTFNYFICPKGKCLDTSPQDFLTRRDMEYYAMLAAVEYIDNHFDELSL